MAWFLCNVGSSGLELTVTCDSLFAGATITCTDGTSTLTKTCPSSSPYVVKFSLPNGGIWTISGTYSGETYSTSATIDTDVNLTRVPNGSTATPTDDIQTWLHCANIWDKNYTTISEVLADGTTVTALIASTNAVDYMARSTTWANTVCADSSAMTKIGANNYCANTLLADSTWLNAICNSTYMESVLNVKVPTMTSNTTPSGEASASTTSSTSGYEAYKVFDGNNSTYWQASSGATPQHLTYAFTSAKVIKSVYLYPVYSTSQARVKNFKIQGSNDNFVNDSHDLLTDVFPNQNGGKLYTLTNSEEYKYYRLYIVDNWGTGDGRYCQVNTLQFYGRTDV